MRPETRKLLLSTTSAAALAVLAGTMIVRNPASGADVTINGVTSTTQVNLNTANDDLLVTGNGKLDVDGAYAVLMNANNTTVTTGGAGGPGLITASNAGGGAINVGAIAGFTITNNGNGVISAQATADQATILIQAGAAGGTINNSGLIDHLGGNNLDAIRVAGTSTVTINNNATATIFSAQGSAIDLAAGTITGAINNSGTISTGNGGGSTDAAINVASGVSLSGGIVNKSTGVISASTSGRGIRLAQNSSVSIDNAGKIIQENGGTNAQAIYYFDDQTSSLTNSGTIEASGTGTNSGAIVFDVLASVTGSINNQTGGVIRATGQGASAISFEADTSLTGGITNAGTIEATDNTADDVGVAIRIDRLNDKSLTIANNAGGVIAGSGKTRGAIDIRDIRNDITVTITNNGTIRTSSTNTDARAVFILVANQFAGLSAMTTINNGTTGSGTIENTGDGENAIEIRNNETTNQIAVRFAINNGTVLSASGTIDGRGGRAIYVDTGTGMAMDAGIGIGNITNGGLGTGTIKNKSDGAATIQVDGTLSGKIENYGRIDNDGSNLAIDLSTGTLTGGLVNRASGVIESSGATAVQLGQNVFTIEGGQVKGDTLGGDTSKVDFNLAAVTLETTPGDGGFSPVTGTYGFTTNGDFKLDLNPGTSSINVNSGALFVAAGDTVQAEDVLIGAGAVMGLGNGAVVIVGPSTFINSGLLFVPGGAIAQIQGDGESKGAGNMLGFGLAHPTPGTAAYGRFDINPGPGGSAGTFSLDANTTVRIYNDFKGYTPATGILPDSAVILVDTDAGSGLSINGVTASGTLAAMDSAFNDTATLRFVAKISDPFTDPNHEANNLDLFVIRTPFNSALHGFTANQNAAGGALENIGAGGNVTGDLGNLLGVLESLTSEAQLGNALQQTLPIHNGAALYGSMIGFDSMLQSIDTRLANFQNQYVSAGGGAMGLSGAAGGRLNGLWMRAGGGTGTQDTQGGPGGAVAGFRGRTYHGTIGADREIAEAFRIGATFGYADSKFEGNGDDVGNARLKVRSYQGSLYAAWQDWASGWWASGVVGGGTNRYEGRRSMFIDGPVDFFDTKTSEYNGYQITAKAMLGKSFGDERSVTLSPFVSFRYSHIHIDRYSEEGVLDDGASLNVAAQNYDQALGGVGVRLAAPVMSGGGLTFLPWLRASYQYDFVGDRQVTSATFGGDTNPSPFAFTTRGAQPGRHILNGGAGVNVFTGGAFSMALSYDYERRNDAFNGHSGFVQGRIGF